MAQTHSHDGDDYFGATERTPLVGNVPTSTTTAAAATPSRHHSSRRRPLLHVRGTSIASIAGSIKVPKAHDPSTIIVILAGIILCASGSGAIMQVASTRVFEDIFCRQYYADRPEIPLGDHIDETRCKENEIQTRLAYLFAVSSSIDAIVGCICALSWGAAADRIGRRTVLAFAVAGFTLQIAWIMIVGWFSDTIPVHFYWFSSIALLCGGGNAAANACIGGMVTDLLPEMERSLAFMRIHVASSVGNLVAPALASMMMSSSRSPWPVFFTSLSIMALCGIAMLFVPETLHNKPDSTNNEAALSLKDRAKQALQECRSLLSIMKDPSVCLVLAVFFFCLPVSLSTYQFMLQFVSKRYGIPIAETGYIQTIYGMAHILVVLIFLPWLTKFVVRPSTTRFLRIENRRKRDIVLARWSYAIIILGALVLAVSPRLPGFVTGLLVMSLGAGGESMVKSTASTLVAPDQTSRLFSLIGVVIIGGMVWTGPMLAALFDLGMYLDGKNAGGGGAPWIGLPYFGVAGTAVIMLILVSFVRAPSEAQVITAEDGIVEPSSREDE